MTVLATITGFSTDTATKGDWITSDTHPIISGSIVDTAMATFSVTLFATAGSTHILMGTDTTIGSGTWDVGSATLPDGTYRIEVFGGTLSTYPGGIPVVSKLITIDSTAPSAVATVTAIGNDTGTSSHDFITNAGVQTVTGTYSGTLLSGEVIQVSVDRVNWTNATANGADNTWSAAGISLSTGALTQFYVRTLDAAGNFTDGTGHVYTYDAVAPTQPSTITITGLSADTGASSTDFITSQTFQTVSGTYSGLNAPASTDVIQVSSGGGWATGMWLGGSIGTWTCNIGLADGDGVLQVRISDAAGNLKYGTSHAYTLDNTPATVAALSSDSGTAGDFVTNVAQQTVTGTYAGVLSSLETIQISGDGTSWVNATAGANAWSANLALSGTGVIQVRTVDTAGNVTVGTGHAYTIDTAAPAAPVITGINPDVGMSVNDGLTKLSQVAAYGTAEANSSVAVYSGGALVGTATADGTGNWTFSPVILAEGANSLTAIATDTAGNTGAASQVYVATLDTSPPAVGTIVVAGNGSIDNVGEETSLVVSGTVTGSSGGNALVRIYDGSTLLDTRNVIVTDGAFSATFTGHKFPATGHYSVKVTATDSAGNTMSSPKVQTFDTTVCFLGGTMIRTPEGETAVEKLEIGDLVVTDDGRARPVRFIGRQTVSLIFADKLKSQPICIRAGALDENVPMRDLYTSPGHAMILDGLLVIAGALVNGRSIVRWEQAPKVFTYYHVELDEHCVIYANGAATETYCDNIARDVFDNGSDYLRLYPDAEPIMQMDLPHVKSARQLPKTIRQRLEVRATEIAG